MQKQPKNHKYMLSKPFKMPFSEKENWRVDSQLLVVGTTHAHTCRGSFFERSEKLRNNAGRSTNRV